MNKKILIASIVTLASVAGVVGTVGNAHKVDAATIPAGTNLYFDPCDQWKNNMINNGGGKERYAAYFFGGAGEKWLAMKDSNSDGIWEVTTTQQQGNVIFCAMNPGNSTLGWGAKWNQTKDLTYDGVNNLVINSDKDLADLVAFMLENEIYSMDVVFDKETYGSYSSVSGYINFPAITNAIKYAKTTNGIDAANIMYPSMLFQNNIYYSNKIGLVYNISLVNLDKLEPQAA
jgi:hypothetical protein